MRTNPFERDLTPPDVSIVLPCLNQGRVLPFAIANARAALVGLDRELGLTGEIIVADGGSRDGSQMIALAENAQVIDAPSIGYGAALSSGLAAARGRYLVMGDVDGSCDFRDCVTMVRNLMRGADLCLGSRIMGASGCWDRFFWFLLQSLFCLLLRCVFGLRLSDATCRLRAISAFTFKSLSLQARGVEFTTEMIVKAGLLGCRIVEAPCHRRRTRAWTSRHVSRLTLRHLRYVLLLSPAWLFLVPASASIFCGLFCWFHCFLAGGAAQAGSSSGSLGGFVLAGALLCLGHLFSLFALAAHLYACREGLRVRAGAGELFGAYATIRFQLNLGSAAAAAGLCLAALPWLSGVDQLVSLVTAAGLWMLALQAALGAFLVAILCPGEAVAPAGRLDHAMPPAPVPVRLGL